MKKEKPMNTVAYYLPTNLIMAIAERAKRENRSPSNYVSTLLAQAIDESASR